MAASPRGSNAMTDTPRHLVRASDLDPAEAVCIRHPFNPTRGSPATPGRTDRDGRVIVTLPGAASKESFVLHAHMLHEEFVYILEGKGTAVIGEAELEVGPGDFMGFPIDGTAHTLRNTGTERSRLPDGRRARPARGRALPDRGQDHGVLDAGRHPGVRRHQRPAADLRRLHGARATSTGARSLS